jgi:hypothetical protein
MMALLSEIMVRMSLFMRGGGDYEDFLAANSIEQEGNNSFDAFISEIMTSGNQAPRDLNDPAQALLPMENPEVPAEMREGLRAVSSERMNLYYQLIKDVGKALGINEEFNSPIDISLDKMDHDVQEKLEVFSEFYKLGEGCNSQIRRIPREAPVVKLDSEGFPIGEESTSDEEPLLSQAREKEEEAPPPYATEQVPQEVIQGKPPATTDEPMATPGEPVATPSEPVATPSEPVAIPDEPLEESMAGGASDPHELCSSVPNYKLGIDVDRWPSNALMGEMITKVTKVVSKDPTFFERLVLVKKHFPTKELVNAFEDSQYRLRRLFDDFIYKSEILPDDDKLLPYEKQERDEFKAFSFKYMALFALQEISRQVLELIKETQGIEGELDKNEGWRCVLGQGKYAGAYPELMGMINRDTVARTVCLGETYAIACAGPRKWHSEETKVDGAEVEIYKAGPVDKKWWRICQSIYDKQEIADKLRFSIVALFFTYMPVKDEYKVYTLPTDSFNKIVGGILQKRKDNQEEPMSPKLQQKYDQLAKMQTVVKSKILLDEILDVDKFTAVAYDQFSKKFPENMLEYTRVSFTNYKVNINSVVVRFNKDEVGGFPVPFKYRRQLQTYVRQTGAMEPLRMKEPIDMKVHRPRQSGGRRRSRRPVKRARKVFSARRQS